MELYTDGCLGEFLLLLTNAYTQRLLEETGNDPQFRGEGGVCMQQAWHACGCKNVSRDARAHAGMFNLPRITE